VRRPRISDWLRATGLPADRQSLWHLLTTGLVEASRFSTPLFTPATKAALGQHDENISFARVIEMVGGVRANQLRDRTLQTYIQAADRALRKGIIIADTNSRFGIDVPPQSGAGRRGLHPRFVEVLARCQLPCRRGSGSFDKQFVRNWLTGPESGWDRSGSQPPPPASRKPHRRTRSPLCRGLRAEFPTTLRRLDRSGRMNRCSDDAEPSDEERRTHCPCYTPPVAKRVQSRRRVSR